MLPLRGLPLTRRRLLGTAAGAAGALFFRFRPAAGETEGAAAPLHAPPGSWWQYRADRRLSGRSDVRGAIRKPEVRWTYPIAGRETLLVARLQPGPAKRIVLDNAERLNGPSWGETERDWRLPGPYLASWLDLDDDGKLTAVSRSYNAKIGKMLPGVPGLQLVETEPKGYPKVPNVYKGTVRLKVRERGQWVTRWETETQQLIWQAEPVFGDFDRDGKIEIAALPWFRLSLFDAETGKLKEQCNFLAEDESENPGEGGRAYGWFGAVDVDRDGEPEFVIIEDFIRYATVIKRRNGKLERLWLKVWEPRREKGQSASPEDTVVVRINPEPVQDIDGDGRAEIVVSIFNLERDHRWHVVALDVLTGKTKLDLPGQFLHGLRDVDGCGRPELLCTAVESGPRIPDPSRLTLFSVREGKARPVWTLGAGTFVTSVVEGFPSNVNSGAALGSETVLCNSLTEGSLPVFFTQSRRDPEAQTVRVSCWQAQETRREPRMVASWEGPGLAPVTTRAGANGGILLRASSFDGEAAEVRGLGKRGCVEKLISRVAPAPVSPVVVGRPAPGERPIVVVQGANETVEGFRPSAQHGERGTAERLWRVPGRGMTCNNYYEGLLLADLDGTGVLSVVAGTRGTPGCARLKVMSAATGQTRWTHDFTEFPGAPPPWNVPGLMYWECGYFRDRRRMDLLIQNRRVGGESTLLDGRTGQAVWRQTRGRPGRDFGRWWFAMADYDGDGLEDILNVYPDMFCFARGRDGELLVAEESHKYVDLYAYYADVLVADFLGRGAPQVLYLHEFVTALLTLRGERIWKADHPHPGGWRNQAGYGDADGSGRLALFFPGASGEHGREFHCRDAATGGLRWSLRLPDDPVTFPAVADIDGDGRDECLFTMGRTLYAVGEKKGSAGGAVLWKLDFPDRLGPVAFADVRGEGTGEILVVCADGRVYGIA